MVYALDLTDPAINPFARISTMSTLLNVIVPLLMIVGALLFFFMLLVGAFSYLTSEGKPESIKKAQQTLTFAMLGLIIILASYIIVKIIAYVLKVDIPI